MSEGQGHKSEAYRQLYIFNFISRMKGGDFMRTKGYITPFGYMGFIPATNNYLLFATENEYYEYLTESR